MGLRVKICGITRAADAEAAVQAGASAVGIVFWPGSPRCVSVERAEAIVRAVDGMVTVVGVFVDQAPSTVQRLARSLRLDAIQLHGSETIAQYRFGRHVLKSVAVAPGWTLDGVRALPADVLPLLDVKDEARKGGTGRRVEPVLAAAAAALRPIVLAGGLTGENVAAAIAEVRPYAVDVSSGVERAPGIKDATRVRAFIRAAREAGGDVPRGLFA